MPKREQLTPFKRLKKSSLRERTASMLRIGKCAEFFDSLDMEYHGATLFQWAVKPKRCCEGKFKVACIH